MSLDIRSIPYCVLWLWFDHESMYITLHTCTRLPLAVVYGSFPSFSLCCSRIAGVHRARVVTVTPSIVVCVVCVHARTCVRHPAAQMNYQDVVLLYRKWQDAKVGTHIQSIECIKHK